MPTTLGERYSIDWRGRPPHMLPTDIPVWWRFLDRYGDQVRSIYYDCFLGGVELTPEDELDPMKRMWRATTAKRADAIAETQREVWIIEVSDYPGMRALGQLLTYQTLWLEDPRIDKIERLLLIAGTIDTDVTAASVKFGVLVYVLPETAP
jgi:hypothetical protein